MSASPRFKIYNPRGEYIACCKHPEDAAAIVAVYGEGATIRDGHSRRNIVWAEGREASDSYDEVADKVWSRVNRGGRKP